MTFQFLLMVGLPGSGKTSFMRKMRTHHKQNRAYVFLFDDLTQSGGHKSLVKMLKRFVSQKQKFVPDFDEHVHVLISDFGFILPSTRMTAAREILTDFPDATVEFVFWE